VDVSIVGRILGFLEGRGASTVTELVRGARVGFSTARFYLRWLGERGLVRIDRGARGSLRVSITDRGRELLRLIREVESMLGV